jgi:hypothetical protein
MVQAILAGRKTQTRRLVKWRPLDGANLDFSGLEAGSYCTGVPESGWVLRSRGAGGCWNDRTEKQHCRHGSPGDRLWVRETWTNLSLPGYERALAFRADGDMELPLGVKWRPSLLMPRWASRISLNVTGVRVERLQAISEDDARAEGASYDDDSRRVGFQRLWDSINGKRAAWATNPWVWVVSFARVAP